MFCHSFGGYGYYGYGGIGNWIGMIFSVLFFMLLAIGIGLFIWWLVRAQAKTQYSTGSLAMEILNERYAKGDISKEDYDDKKKDLI